MTNNQNTNNPIPLPEETPVPAEPKRIYFFAEKLLLPVALLVAVLFDRLMFAPLFAGNDSFPRFAGVFWLCYLVIFYAFYWTKLVKNRVLWYVAACAAALCAWSFVFFGRDSNVEYTILTILVVPAVLMAHAQFAAGDYKLKDVGKLVTAWLLGWFIKPFSGIPALFGAAQSLIAGENKTTVKKALLGAVVTLPLLCVIVPLLSGADLMFGFLLRRLMGDFNFGSAAGHLFAIFIAFLLFYSFFWNIGFGSNEIIAPKAAQKIDTLVSSIVLGSVTLLYVLFCAVQFTYLFAGAGLPGEMTYSEYAREGFAQTVAICAINLFLFAVFLCYGKKSRVLSALLAALLTLTAIMLFSGFTRLRLYIDAYGLTWLRLFSAWFVVYLAAVIVICAVRMVREKLPAAAICALILLGWYVALGYANPDYVVGRYNQAYGYETAGIPEVYLR